MKRIRKKKQLEMAIDSIPSHPNPKVDLEQYSTPSQIASDLLWNAYTLGDIEGKSIADLGCGCGIFAISSILLGARDALGVDIDSESVEVARNYSEDLKNIKFMVNDVAHIDVTGKIDTVFQNPPFGSQKNAEKGTDLNFLQVAKSLNPQIIYSFHMASTFDFLIEYYKKIGLEITHGFRYSFPIPKIYKFHRQESRDVEVIVFRAKVL